MICGHCNTRDVSLAHVKSHMEDGSQSVKEAITPPKVGDQIVLEFKDPKFTMESTAVKKGPGRVPPTEKQLNFAHKLLEKYRPVEAPEILDIEERDGITAAHEAINAMDKGTIGHYLSRMTKSAEHYIRRTPPTSQKIQAREGIYEVDGEVYKVITAIHGSGHLYAKVLTATGFSLAPPGSLSKLRPEHRVSLERALEYGQLYGVCMRCGRTLTDEKSIAAGIGPVCRNKFAEEN